MATTRTSYLPTATHRTNSTERVVLQGFFEQYVSDINVPNLIKILQGHHMLEQSFTNVLSTMYERGETKEFVLQVLCNELLDQCSLDKLVQVLFLNENKELARILFNMYQDQRSKTWISRMSKVEIGNREKITLYFKQIKKLVHDIGFEHPYLDVRELGERLKLRIEREKDSGKKMYLCDKYVAHKAAEMDALSNISNSVDVDHEGFRELGAFVEASSVPALSRLILLGRKADQLSTVRRFGEGEDMLRESYICADSLMPCAEITDMVYKGVVFRLSQFEETPTKELQDMIFLEAYRGMWMLTIEHEDVQVFWRRLFLLRMVFALLGIGKQCRIVQNYSPDDECIAQAKELLNRPELEKMEIRREMFKLTALARLSDVTGQREAAVEFIKKAKEIAIQGKYAEVNGIGDYLKDLDQQS